MLGVAKFKRARFLIASTSEVYGDPQVHPQKEDYWGHVNPIGPRGVYDEAKRYAEALTMAYHRQQGVDTAIVRIFNTYGPRMRAHDGRAIPTFLRQALQDRPLTVFGDGSQTRSFCYVDDLIRGIVALAESDEHTPVNIGNPNEFTLLELAKAVIEVTEFALGDRLRGAADRRPPAAPPRHRPRPRPARLGADGRADRRACAGRSSRPASSASSAPPTEPGPLRRRATAGSTLSADRRPRFPRHPSAPRRPPRPGCTWSPPRARASDGGAALRPARPRRGRGVRARRSPRTWSSTPPATASVGAQLGAPGGDASRSTPTASSTCSRRSAP